MMYIDIFHDFCLLSFNSIFVIIFEPREKPVSGVSVQVRHKPGCTTTEDDLKLKISDLERRGIVLSI